jgi:predicted naringenin-chalcone synthase
LKVKVTDAPHRTSPAAAAADRGARAALHAAAARTPLPHAPAAPRITGLEVADADTALSQDEVLTLLHLKGDEFAERIFSRCGVQHRRLNLSGEVLELTLQGRTRAIEDELFRLAVQAVDRLQIDPTEIGTVVTGTLYSLGGPTLAHRLVDHYEMCPATDKYHVLGVGCASAVPLMRFMTHALQVQPQKKGLIVAAESMAGILMRASEGDSRAKIIGSSLFGDGCAAALLDGSDERAADGALTGGGALADNDAVAGPAIVASKVHQIGRTLGAVRMELAADDSYLHLDRDLPDVAAAGLAELADEFLAANGIGRDDIEHWIVHPGGRRIIESVQTSLDLSDEQVAISWDVLSNRGNVGTPSIFYVLKWTIEQRRPAPGELGFAITIGPGITVGLMLLRW